MSAPRLRTSTAAALRTMPLPSPGGDKEQRGRVLIVGESMRVPGAALLATILNAMMRDQKPFDPTLHRA